jgi:uncharacterized protein YcbK (DUF882 family)
MNKFEKTIEKLMIGPDGKVSWTAVLVIHALLLFWTVYISVFVFEREVSEALLVWTLEVMILFVAPRPFQKSFSRMIEGTGKVFGKKETESSIAKENDSKGEVRAKNITEKKKLNRVNKINETASNNFSIKEFESNDGSKMPAAVKRNIMQLIEQLEIIRSACGDRPITITSGYRSPEHNSKEGGAKNSQHIKGTAADFKVAGLTPKQVGVIVKNLIQSNQIIPGGLGIYARGRGGWVHYDIRGTFVEWKK